MSPDPAGLEAPLTGEPQPVDDAHYRTASDAHRLAVEYGGNRFEWRADGVYLNGQKVPGATVLGANRNGPLIEFGPWPVSEAAKDMLREAGWNV